MTFDFANNKVILFGGKGKDTYNDTWTFDSTTNKWSNLSPTGTLPPARFGHAMAFDSSAKKVIIFGGVVNTTNRPTDDTWAYDPGANAWSHLDPGGSQPPARVYPSMIYNPVNRKVLLFGGWTGTDAFNASASGGTRSVAAGPFCAVTIATRLVIRA